MIEEFTAILGLLGDVSEIAGWVFGIFLSFKLIIMLSTTGSIVYLSVKALDIIKDKLTKPSVRDDVKIKDVTINGEVYDSVIYCLDRVRKHVNSGAGIYIHNAGANFLKEAIEEKIVNDRK